MSERVEADPGHRRCVGIVGGAGPYASHLLHRYILAAAERTTRVQREQDQVDIIHLSLPSWIADRTEFLLGRSSINPAHAAVKIVQLMERMELPIVAGVACNTFHAEPIWSVFASALASEPLRHVEIVNMLRELGHFLDERHAGARIGVLCTSGSRKAQLFEGQLQPLGLEVLQIPEQRQEELQQAIYDPAWGLKAVYPAAPRARQVVEDLCSWLVDAGAKRVVLGCTELPLAFEDELGREESIVVDPMQLLARVLVTRAQG